MYLVWKYTALNGYLYTATGIATCFVVGYALSFVLPAKPKDLSGLTIYTLRSKAASD